MNSRNRFLLAASLATAIAAPILAQSTSAPPEQEKKEVAKCYGVNKCKGVGDCGGQGHSCKGKNSCKRQGYVEMDKETCLKLDGGSLTPVQKQ